VLARSGARVALIEADLRRPRVTRYLGMISGAGLSNVLAGTARAEELLQPYGDGNLQVLAAGPMPPNPSEMLGSRHMQALLKELREHHDYVLIDAPPVLPVTDGAVLSVAADGALLVIRHGVTTRAQVRQASESLHRIEARLLGTVINRVPVKAAEGYGYGYGYSYSAVSDLTGEFPAIRDGGAPGRRGSHRTDPTPAGSSARK
jgi:succinoglycan biosynthesis transport protein ExoP